jgi:hypothetical protein
LFLFSESPATQDVTISSGFHTLSVTGTGTASTSYGSAVEGAPLTFNSPGETLTVTINGTLLRCWLEPLPYQTNYIESRDVQLSRDADQVQIYNQNNVVLSDQGFTITADLTVYGAADGAPVIAVDTTLTSGFRLHINQDRTITATIKDNTGIDYSITTSSTFDAGVRRSLAVGYDNQSFFVAVSGVIEQTVSITEQIVSSTFEGLTTFGGAGFNAAFGEVRFYDVALNFVEIDYLSRG